MAEKEFYMRLHGDMLHNVVIFLLKCIWLEKGGRLMDERQFKKKHICPCEPDMYGEYEAKMIKGNTRQTEKKLLVAEVETHATAESIRKKQQQYEESMAGIQLVVLDIDKYRLSSRPKIPMYNMDSETLCVIDENSLRDWRRLKEWIESELPI